jgi:hypothetical protein
MGVGEAGVFFEWTRGAASGRNTSTSRSRRPSAALSRSARSEQSPSAAAVSQIRPPAITGEDQPRPGIAVLQAMFSESLQKTGRSTSSEWP